TAERYRGADKPDSSLGELCQGAGRLRQGGGAGAAEEQYRNREALTGDRIADSEASMDVARPQSVARNKKIKRILAGILVLIVAPGVTLGLSRMKPAAPSVDRATVWVDTVKRGEMLRQVRGIGTLVPEEVRWIPATSDGIIEERRLRAGDIARPD